MENLPRETGVPSSGKEQQLEGRGKFVIQARVRFRYLMLHSFLGHNHQQTTMLSPRLSFFAFGGIVAFFLHLTLVSRVLHIWLTSFSSLSSSLKVELDRGVFWLLIFIFSILSTFSRKVRCILFLCFPTLVATQSRRFVVILILTTLVQDGPLDTIGMNTFNVIQSIKCQARNQLVMAERQMELLFNPVQQILERIVQNQVSTTLVP